MKLKEKEKTKEQLLKELAEARQRITQLEASETERKKAGEMLQQGKAYMESILNSVPDMLVVLNRKGEISYVNDAITRFLGVEGKDIVGNSMVQNIETFTRLSPESVDELNTLKEHLQTGESVTDVEIEIPNNKGKLVPCSYSASGIRDSHGDITGHMVILRDISERKRTEEMLKESEERYRNLIENASDAIFTTSLDGTIISVNQAAETITGWSRSELIGKSFVSIIHPNDLTRVMEEFGNVSEGTALPASEARVLLKSGEYLILEVCGTPQIREGKQVGFFGIGRDITERRRVEEERVAALKMASDVMENMLDGIVITDMNGRIIDINRAAIERTYYVKEEVIGRTPIELEMFMMEADRPKFFAELQKLLGGESIAATEYQRKGKDGTTLTTSVSLSVLKDPAGNPTSIITVHKDITERKRAEKQLKEYSENLEQMIEARTRELRDAHEKLVRSEKLAAIGQMAGEVGHELRNPLGVIGNSAYFLKMRMGDVADEKIVKHLGILEQQVGVCSKIISDLLDFSRPGKTEVEEVYINQVVQGVVQAIEPSQDVEISTSLAGDLAPVMVDAGQMERVFSNLITNAIQAMSQGGRLTLSTGQRDGFIEVRVTDTGVGIPKENLSKIFEPLFTTKAKGVGLGLALAKALVERQRGDIEVESQDSKGTTFTVKLPVANAKVQRHGESEHLGS